MKNSDLFDIHSATEDQINFLRMLIDSFPFSVFMLDADLRYITYNKLHEEFTSKYYKVQFKQGMHVLDSITVEDDRQKAAKNLNKILKGESIVEKAYLGDDHTGKKSFEIGLRPITNGNASVVGVFGTIHAMDSNSEVQNQLFNKSYAIQSLLELSAEFVAIDAEINYDRISDIIIKITGAKYASLNIFNQKNNNFSTFAFSGLKNIQNISKKYLGFNLFQKEWEHDPVRAAKIKNQTITRFEKLEDLVGSVLNQKFIRIIQDTFRLGEAVVLKINKDEMPVGDFTLIFEKGKTIQNEDIAELFAHQGAIFIEGKRTQLQLFDKERKYHALFENLNTGFALHEIILDKKGNPIDYRFLEVNKTFEDLTGLKGTDIIGKTCLEVMPDIEFSWIQKYGEVALKGETLIFEEYSAPLNKYFHVSAYSPEKGRFATFFLDISDQKNTAQVIKENEQKFKAIFENNSAAIAIYEHDTTIIMVNETYCRLTGYTREEVIGTSWTTQITADDLDRMKEYSRLRKIDPALAPDNYEFKFYRKDGSIRHCYVSISVLEQTNQIVASFVDINDAKIAELALEKSEKQKRKILETSADGFLMVDLQGNFLDINDAYSELIGYTREEILTMNVAQIELNEELEDVQKHIQKIIQFGNEVFQTKHQCKNGNIIDVEVSTNLLKDDKLFFVFVRDITEKKHKEELLRSSELFFRESQMAANIGSYNLNLLTGKWTSSEVLDQIFGIDTDYNRTVEAWLDVVHPDDREMMNQYFINDVLGQHLPFNKEYSIRKISTGEERWVLGLGKLLLGNDGEILSMVGTIQDITDRKQSEINIRKNKDRLNRAEFASKSGNWELELDNMTMKASKGAVKLYGLTKNQFDYAEIKDIPLPEYRPLMDKALSNLIHQNEPYELEFKIKKADTGEIIDIYSTATYDKEKRILFGVIRDITERKQMDDAIRESEEFFRIVFEESVISMIITAPDGKLIKVNKAFAKMLGYTIDEIEQRNFTEFTHPDDVEKSTEIIRSILANEKKSGQIEKRYIHKDGSSVWVDLYTVLNCHSDNSPKYFITSATNITQKKKVELNLRDSEEKFRSIAEQTADFIAITDDKGIIVYASPASRDLLLMEPEEIVGHHFNEFTDSSYTDKAIESFRNGIATGNRTVQFEFSVVRKDHKTVHIEINGSNYEFNNIVGRLIVMHDITERRNAEKQIKESEETFRLMFENNPQPMFIYDLETLQFLEVNRAAEQHYGYTREEFLATDIKTITPEEEIPYLLHMINETRKGNYSDGEWRHQKKNGEIIYVEISSASIVSKGKDARHVFVKDISSRKLAEQALNAKMEELMRFQHLTVDREMMMITLKKEINELLLMSGKESRYKIVE